MQYLQGNFDPGWDGKGLVGRSFIQKESKNELECVPLSLHVFTIQIADIIAAESESAYADAFNESCFKILCWSHGR